MRSRNPWGMYDSGTGITMGRLIVRRLIVCLIVN